MAEIGSESAADGMIRCTGCSRYYAPEDMEGFGKPDFLTLKLECRWCFRRRTGG